MQLATAQTANEPPLPAPVIDTLVLSRLGELDPGGGNGLVVRLLGVYDATLPQLMGEFQAARALGDTQVVRRVVHTLKSSSASIGAVAFSALCARAEAAVVAGSTELQSLLDQVGTESQRVARAVRQLLPH